MPYSVPLQSSFLGKYEPDGGDCVLGPPCGKALYAVPLLESEGMILALCPDPLPD